MPKVINDQGIWIEEDASFSKLTPLKLLELHAKSNTDNEQYALLLENTDEVMDLRGSLNSVARIQVKFPLLADGRAYSQVKLLRQRLNYEGDIRATGEVQLDQLFIMRRVGISSFELGENESVSLRSNPALVQKLFKPFSQSYQS